MPNLDLAKKRVEAEIAKYGGIHIEGEAPRAEEWEPGRMYTVLSLDSDNKPKPTRYMREARKQDFNESYPYSDGLRKNIWFVAGGPLTGTYWEVEGAKNRLYWGRGEDLFLWLEQAKSDPLPKIEAMIRLMEPLRVCDPQKYEEALKFVRTRSKVPGSGGLVDHLEISEELLNDMRSKARSGNTEAAHRVWRAFLEKYSSSAGYANIIYSHYMLDVPWYRLVPIKGYGRNSCDRLADAFEALLSLFQMNEAFNLGGFSRDQIAEILAKEPWRCRQFLEISKLLKCVKTPSQARAIARRYIKDNKLDVLAKKLLGGTPKAEQLLPLFLQDYPLYGRLGRNINFIRRAKIQDPQWWDKAAKHYEIDKSYVGALASNMETDFNRMHRMFEGITEEEFVKDVLLKYSKDQVNTLMDTLGGLQDHREALTQPEVVDANPWIHHLYSARQRHEWNRLANPANHDRLMNLIRELQRVQGKDDKKQVAWHANALKFKLQPGITPLETQEKQLARGVSEKHCCGLFTWQKPENLVFAFDDATTGDTATLEVHVPTQRVLQFYGPENSAVTSPKLLAMLDEFMRMNKDVMDDIAKNS